MRIGEESAGTDAKDLPGVLRDRPGRLCRADRHRVFPGCEPNRRPTWVTAQWYDDIDGGDESIQGVHRPGGSGRNGQPEGVTATETAVAGTVLVDQRDRGDAGRLKSMSNNDGTRYPAAAR